MKEVQDRVVQFSNRYKLTNAETGEVLGTFDFDEVTGTVQQVGTEIDKELFDSIANDLAARVVSAGGELAGTIVTFSDISGTAANIASGDTSATLWGKVKNWFSRLKALAFKDKISNTDIADNAAIAQSKINGLESALDAKANDADLAAIAKSGDLADATQDATHRVVTDTEKATWNAKQNAITGAASTIVSSNLTESRALVSDASGKVAVSDVTATELGYLDGAKSNIQEQLDGISSGTGFVSTSPQTLTTEQQSQARENIGAASVAEMKAGDDKSYYNLGAYDTYVDNGDGTVTVTRKTGRYNVPINDFEINVNNCFEIYNITLPNTDKYFVVDPSDQESSNHAISNVYPLGFWGIDDTFYISDDNFLRVFDNSYSKDATGLAQFKASLEAAGGMYILYETDTSYPEKLPANVPIHTLDVNGEQFVRDEWEKGLNLAETLISSKTYGVGIDAVSIVKVKPGSTYTISYTAQKTSGIAGNGGIILLDTDSAQVPSSYAAAFADEGAFDRREQVNISVTISHTMSNEYLQVLMGGTGQQTQTIVINNLMINEGSHAYPYQPYNGAIVHEKDLETASVAEAEKIKELSSDQMQLLINFFQNLTPFYFDEETETANVIGLNDYGKTLIDIEIPSEYHGKTVTGIAMRGNEGAFEDCTNLESVVIPSSVTSIGSNTFADCTSLASITLPQGITEIGYGAFYNCSSLESITYQGTIAEWNSIDKSTGIGAWDEGTGSYVVHCTDGDVNKS